VPSLDQTITQILALPREAGTPQAAAARELVAEQLRALGYIVLIQKFSFTPGSLRALPLFGAGLGAISLVLLPLLASTRVPPWAALGTWICGLLAVLILAIGVGLGWVALGDARREDANLIATRGGNNPRRWIVAHLDSKAQMQSMAGRLMAVWAVGLALVAGTLLAVARLWGPVAIGWIAAGAAAALIAGSLAGRGRLRGLSQGANKNAELGFLITGAEEFGLVGSRIYAQVTPDVGAAEFVNLDTIDQEGTLYLVTHDRRGQRLAAGLEPALARLGLPIRRRRLPFGILVDSAPLARAGAAALTIGRLTWQTLRRIHTPGDTPDGLSLDTAKRVGEALADSFSQFDFTARTG
jgi:hypothetical protein